MLPVIKNLVVGGMDVHLRKHGDKESRVKFSFNLGFNNGFIFSYPARETLADMVPDGSAANYDNALTNQFV